MNFIFISDKSPKGRKTKGWNGFFQINKKENLASNQIKTIHKKFPKSKIIYIYGFDGKRASTYFEQTQNKNVIGVYNKNYDTSGEVSSLTTISEYLTQECMLLHGDILLKPSVFDNFKKSKQKSKIFISTKHSTELGCVLDAQENVQHICYGLNNYLLGLYYISNSHISLFKQMVDNYSYRNYFLFEIINKMIDHNVSFEPITTNRKNNLQYIKDIKQE